ncbi:MAG: TIGR02281 family clan AA aspartic protease, partial [Novosphingobium sp.]
AVVAAAAGWMMERERPALADALRKTGYLGMLAAGLLLVGQLAYTAERSDAMLELRHRPAVAVSGSETIVPMASDGHFWVTAEVNGRELDFLIDTGATFTGIGRDAAEELGIKPDPQQAPLELETANGVITATLGKVDALRFGNIEVRGLPVAVPQDTADDTQVIGMNLLSQLASWRVEGDRLILVPKT